MKRRSYRRHTPTAAELGLETTATKAPRGRRMRDVEHQEQCAFFRRTELEWREHPELQDMYAIPNEGGRNAREGARKKAEGRKPGVPDTHLPHARDGFDPDGSRRRYYSLYVEFKAEWLEPDGKGSAKKTRSYPSPEQRKRARRLIAAGNAYEVAWNAEEAWQTVVAYLEGRYTQTYEP